MFQFKKSVAARENVKLKIGVTGPSGAGKTFSSLQLAYGIAGDWTKIAVADTENSSALYYAGDKTGPWQHIPLDPEEMPDGYDPRNWVKLIRYVEQDPTIEVLILDSISHEWEGKGGCLDLQTSFGGRYQDWAKVTPLHTAFVDAIRLSRLHVIATIRSKQDYSMDIGAKGKAEVTKVGLKSIQREGMDYEFGVVFDVEMNHFAKTSKDRTGLFAPRGQFKLSAETGQELAEWASSGVEPMRAVEMYDNADVAHQRLVVAAAKAIHVPSLAHATSIGARIHGKTPLSDLASAVANAWNDMKTETGT